MGSKYKFKLDKYPFQQILNLESLLNYWKENAKSNNLFDKDLASNVVNKANKVPGLFKDSPSASLITKHSSLLKFMLNAIISPLQKEHSIWGVATPNTFEYFYTTKKMDELFGKQAKSLSKVFFESLYGENYYGPAIHTYGRILKEFYDADMEFEIPVITFRKYDDELGINKYYELMTNPSFNEVVPVKQLKKLSKNQINHLCDNFYDLGLLMKTIPPENFAIKGFTISSIVESTERHSVSSLKNELLDKNAIVSKELFKKLERRIQSLLKLNNLKIGVAVFNFEGRKFKDYMSRWQTLLPKPELMCDHYHGSLYEKANEDKMPVIINDLEGVEDKTALEFSLFETGYRSLIIVPLNFEDSLVGVLEVGSFKKNDLNQLSLIKLHEVIPLFAIAAARVTVDLNNQIKAKMQEEFTAIHPVVEWRFTETASNMLRQEQGEEFEKEPIIFKDVYPLFGATDIRSSSNERNKAIKNDLAEQLTIADRIFKKANEHKNMPVFEHVRYEINEYLKKLKKAMLSGDETRIIEFLKREVEPVFAHLKEALPEIKSRILDYEKMIDQEHGILYKERNDFEISIGMINDAIASVLDHQEESAQLMFPHYFEKYRTDGIEYNIYLGQAILEKLIFDPVYLKNLRLWQLIVMCQIARKTAAIKSKLPIPLETTQLILVHSNPLSIRFREDEKKFDVEGGYNIRYEITKKRIDKALIKDSKERLTQPGFLSIIYTQPNEYYEYSKYLEYLASIKYIHEEIDNIELENMQGVYGLQAIRVRINLSDDDPKDLKNMEKIADEAKKIVL